MRKLDADRQKHQEGRIDSRVISALTDIQTKVIEFEEHVLHELSRPELKVVSGVENQNMHQKTDRGTIQVGNAALFEGLHDDILKNFKIPLFYVRTENDIISRHFTTLKYVCGIK